MSRRRGGFTLVLVRGGGRRVLHLVVPRWLMASALLGTALVLALLGGTWWDYFALKRAQTQAASTERRVEAQRALLDSVEQRVAEINHEVASLQAAHLRVWTAFGPGPGASARGTGMGGAVAALPLVFANQGPTLPQALSGLSSSVEESGETLRGLGRFIERRRQALMALPLLWPVHGALNSRFGMRPSPWSGEPEFHRGIDIGAHRGTSVHAPASGTVFFAGNGGEYGNTVILDHGRGLRSLYGHLQEVRVRAGQHIERGQVIALTGNTGRSSGPHLHYEIQIHGQAVDPRQYIAE